MGAEPGTTIPTMSSTPPPPLPPSLPPKRISPPFAIDGSNSSCYERAKYADDVEMGVWLGMMVVKWTFYERVCVGRGYLGYVGRVLVESQVQKDAFPVN